MTRLCTAVEVALREAWEKMLVVISNAWPKEEPPVASVPQERTPAVDDFTSQFAAFKPETLRLVEDAVPETVSAVVDAYELVMRKRSAKVELAFTALSAVVDAKGKVFALFDVEVIAPEVVSLPSFLRKLSGMRLRPIEVVAKTTPVPLVARREFVRFVIAKFEVVALVEEEFTVTRLVMVVVAAFTTMPPVNERSVEVEPAGKRYAKLA